MNWHGARVDRFQEDCERPAASDASALSPSLAGDPGTAPLPPGEPRWLQAAGGERLSGSLRTHPLVLLPRPEGVCAAVGVQRDHDGHNALSSFSSHCELSLMPVVYPSSGHDPQDGCRGT